MSRKFELFEDPATLGKLNIEYEIGSKRNTLVQLKSREALKNVHFIKFRVKKSFDDDFQDEKIQLIAFLPIFRVFVYISM